MIELETVEELSEIIADMVGNYNTNFSDDHDEDCNCRGCFVMKMQERIRQSARNELIIPTIEHMLDKINHCIKVFPNM